MPRATAAAAARTAHQILETATALFSTQGFTEVSLDDIARAAGVTRGAVYHHYRNKAGLFRAVVSLLQADVAAAVVDAAERSGDEPETRLRSGSHAFLEAITAGRTARILLVDAPAVIGWEEWRRLDADHSGAHLREALQETGVPDELLEALTAQLSGAMNEAALWITQREDTASARQQAHASLDRLLAAAGT